MQVFRIIKARVYCVAKNIFKKSSSPLSIKKVRVFLSEECAPPPILPLKFFSNLIFEKPFRINVYPTKNKLRNQCSSDKEQSLIHRFKWFILHVHCFKFYNSETLEKSILTPTLDMYHLYQVHHHFPSLCYLTCKSCHH